MSSCFFMSTSPLLPEAYIIILSHVTMGSLYFPVSSAEARLSRYRSGGFLELPLPIDRRISRNLVHRSVSDCVAVASSIEGGARADSRGPTTDLLELLDCLEVAFGSHELRQSARRMTVWTAEVRTEAL